MSLTDGAGGIHIAWKVDARKSDSAMRESLERAGRKDQRNTALQAVVTASAISLIWLLHACRSDEILGRRFAVFSFTAHLGLRAPAVRQRNLGSLPIWSATLPFP